MVYLARTKIILEKVWLACYLCHTQIVKYHFFIFLYMSQVRDALEQFDNALELNPNPTEAQAAFYNKACCHAYR